MFDVSGLGLTGSEFIEALSNYGAKALTVRGNMIRMVTYRGILRDDILETLDAENEIARKKLI